MFNSEHRGLNLFFLSASLILSIALLAAACSSGGGDGDGETPAADETSADGTDNAGPVSFDISLGDNFFEANEFTLSPGQEVTFNITNNGSAVHNMRVDGGDGEYDTDDDTVSDPDVFQAGDTGTLVWTAPGETGAIIFRCDFHPTEMTGAISLE
ncbi:MAG: hypothetical protein IH822_04585 [Chloroflexi bacterium]|nr:hypothetical protein [Chloroflexota bacterium]